jgi:hypothetical protein
MAEETAVVCSQGTFVSTNAIRHEEVGPAGMWIGFI